MSLSKQKYRLVPSNELRQKYIFSRDAQLWLVNWLSQGDNFNTFYTANEAVRLYMVRDLTEEINMRFNGTKTAAITAEELWYLPHDFEWAIEGFGPEPPEEVIDKNRFPGYALFKRMYDDFRSRTHQPGYSQEDELSQNLHSMEEDDDEILANQHQTEGHLHSPSSIHSVNEYDEDSIVPHSPEDGTTPNPPAMYEDEDREYFTAPRHSFSPDSMPVDEEGEYFTAPQQPHNPNVMDEDEDEFFTAPQQYYSPYSMDDDEDGEFFTAPQQSLTQLSMEEDEEDEYSTAQ